MTWCGLRARHSWFRGLEVCAIHELCILLRVIMVISSQSLLDVSVRRGRLLLDLGGRSDGRPQ